MFDSHYDTDKDMALVIAAKQGKRYALEELIRRHQSWIYNIVIRMTGHTNEAEDATQEILIKIITKLETFHGDSSLRTWLYNIVRNYVFNMNRSKRELIFSSFEEHKDLLEKAIDYELDIGFDTTMKELLSSEVKMQCLMGMLLCLKRKQRLVFILGGVFSVNSSIGGEIVGISPENFRQTLSRSRKQLKNYIIENCSLVNKQNTCSCSHKVMAAIEAGLINTNKLLCTDGHLNKVKEVAYEHLPKVDFILANSIEMLYQEQAFINSPDYVERLKKIVFDDVKI